jgi:hypothetical protein
MFGKGKGFIVGFTVGVGTGLVLREILPIVKEVAAPVSKAAIKAGVHIYEKGQEVLWGTVESVEDIVAEAKYEYEEKKFKKAKPSNVQSSEEVSELKS